jgi:hypothetical protein
MPMPVVGMILIFYAREKLRFFSRNSLPKKGIGLHFFADGRKKGAGREK